MASIAFDLFELEPVTLESYQVNPLGLQIACNPFDGSITKRQEFDAQDASFFASLVNRDVTIQVAMHVVAISTFPHVSIKEESVKNLLSFDTQDLAVMVGMGSFAGAILNESGKLLLGAAPAPTFTVAAGVIAFCAGRVISTRLRKSFHG